MEEYIPSYTDISKWKLNIHLNTGGSRSKKIAIDPKTNTEYFFKGSKELPSGEIRYPTEFWSEIVSSKVGRYLGFDMLDYNIAYNVNLKQKVGCLSKSMVNYSENKLTEGKAYLTGYNPNYNPVLDKTNYTFQFISKSLISFGLEKYISKIVEVIIFDAIISNSDRHQENWGVITYFKETIEKIQDELGNKKIGFVDKIFLKLQKFSLTMSSSKSESDTMLLAKSDLVDTNFSPIYDSGCCLGREKEDHVIKQLLTNNQQIEAYIKKGKSEIHWEGINKKISHFDLISRLKPQYSKVIKETINRIFNRYKKDNIIEIVLNIDQELPEELINFKLSKERKELMIKLITLRIEKLFELK